MREPVFVNDRPVRLTPQDFIRYHLQNFPKISRPENLPVIEDALEWVYANFYGVGTMWDHHEDKMVWFEKTQSCYRMLVAWYITDMYPKLQAGLPAMGGIGLKEKKIADVQIKFQDPRLHGKADDDQLLDDLLSNPFGKKARMAIKMCGKRVKLRMVTII